VLVQRLTCNRLPGVDPPVSEETKERAGYMRWIGSGSTHIHAGRGIKQGYMACVDDSIVAAAEWQTFRPFFYDPFPGT